MAIDFPKFTRDLAVALAVAKVAADASDDGGTCNLDTLVVVLPRANAIRVEHSARAAGATHASKRSYYGPGCFSIGIGVNGQANRNTRAVEAAAKSLGGAGWSAHVRYHVD